MMNHTLVEKLKMVKDFVSNITGKSIHDIDANSKWELRQKCFWRESKKEVEVEKMEKVTNSGASNFGDILQSSHVR